MDDDLTKPVFQRRWVWITAGLAVLAIVLVAAFFPRDEATTPQSGPTPTESDQRLPMPSTDPSAGGDVDDLGRPVVVPSNRAGVALPQSESTSPESDANPLARPKGLEWQRVYGAPAPFSRSDGPAEISANGIPSGMSRTPQGATIAGLQLMSRMFFGPKNMRYAVIDNHLVGGSAADRQRLRAEGDILSFTVDMPEIGDVAAEKILVPAAFRVRSGNWSPDAATIDVAFGPQQVPVSEDSDELHAVYRWQSISVLWSDDRWHLKFRPSMLTKDTEEGQFASLDGGEWATWIR